MKTTTLAALGAAAALASPAAAQAHVTLQPDTAEPGGFTRFDVRVPNERDDKATTRVAVKLPPGFHFLSYEPQPGWKVTVKKRKLDQPVERHGEEITEEVDVVTFSGGRIEPGEFKDFGLSVGVPEGKPGTKLTFPSTQRYEGGETVRWIGPEGGDEPAPRVTLRPAAAPAAEQSEDDGDGLAIAALIVGGLGLLAGLAALAVARRRPAAT